MDLANSNPSSKIINILKQILKEYLPGYIDGQIKIQSLCGTTNQVYKVILQSNSPVVFRFLSPIVDRDMEGKIILQLSNVGIIPKCYFTSIQFRLDEYVENTRHAQPTEIIQNPFVLKQIVKKINGFHQIQLFERIPKKIIIEQMFSQQNIKKYQQAVPHSFYNIEQFENLKKVLIKQLQPMKFWLDQNFKNINQKVKFCHNDLNNLNILIKDISQTNKEITLIDFDYIGYNYVAYDLANFLNQTCIQYKGPYPGFDVFRKISKKQIKQVCFHYASKYEGLQQDIEKMLVLVNYYWAFWSILIKPTTATPSFCPLKHGLARWQLVKYYKSICHV